jgi:hypothetical protein
MLMVIDIGDRIRDSLVQRHGVQVFTPRSEQELKAHTTTHLL